MNPLSILSRLRLLSILAAALVLPNGFHAAAQSAANSASGRFLYVAAPGIRDDLSRGGHGVLVFDIDHGHRFVRRIPAAGLGENGKPMNVKGVCASAATGRLFVSTLAKLACYDLATDKLLWEKSYPGGCDRMSITPDGAEIYLPTLERDHWHVVKGESGEILATLTLKSAAHNTIVALDGSRAFLAGRGANMLSIADVKTRKINAQAGPFGGFVRPFTVNGRATLAFCCVDDLLGFEIADLATGKLLHRVEVKGFSKGPTLRHGCPCHGIGLTPDEHQLWLCDSHNKKLHVFDARKMPPEQMESIALADEPGWVTFSLDGAFAYPSTGQVVDTASRRILLQLKDETGASVQSEKMVEIHFADGKPSANGDQFGLGRVR
jgi:hypothetical protein